MLRYFKNFHVLKRYTLPYIYSSITLGEEEIKIILEDSERNYRHQMHLVVPCDLLVTFSSGSEAVLLFLGQSTTALMCLPFMLRYW